MIENSVSKIFGFAHFYAGVAHNVLIQDESEWRPFYTEGQGFLLIVKGGKRNVTGIRIQNAAQPWASKEVRVSGAAKESGPWTSLVEEELEETTAIQTFKFSRSVVVQFLKFELISFAGQRGGGLRFFSFWGGKVYSI